MHTTIHPLIPSDRSPAAEVPSTHAFRLPVYDCQERRDAMKLVVYVPGVDASGVDIEARGPDVTVTARKAHVVRVNWQALHLESAQRDYQLRLRLGTGFDYPAMHAEIRNGILTVTLPKRQRVSAPARLRRVA